MDSVVDKVVDLVMGTVVSMVGDSENNGLVLRCVMLLMRQDGTGTGTVIWPQEMEMRVG